MTVFPAVVKGDGALRYVFPSKQRDAAALLRAATEDPRIEKLIVFGSAVTPDCGDRSDIDVAVSAPGASEEDFLDIAKKLHLAVSGEADIVRLETVRDPGLKAEIESKGVTLYAGAKRV